jgi:hypothetical protein
MTERDDVMNRIRAVESQLRRLRVVLAGAILAATAIGLSAWRSSQDRVIRAQQLIIQDEQGRDRMFIGRHSTFGGQRAPSIGMAINDTVGFERFGMGLRPNGRMSMGFDAPLGKGDDRNRERINIIADEDGGAQIRFLDRATFVKGRLTITPDNRFVVEFLDFPEKEVRSRLVSFAGDTIIATPR